MLFQGAERERRNKRRATSHSLLSWAAAYLPAHTTLPPSKMHVWLADQLARAAVERGARINVIGPRGGAKSTVGTMFYVLKCAVEKSEPYIWIVSDTSQQAAAHLDNVKCELLENIALARDYPEAVGRGPVWRRNRVVLRNGVTLEAHGTGQRIRGRRYQAHRPSLIVCDDLQNDGHAVSADLRDASRRWFHGTLMKAGDRRTNFLHLATALHREALAWELSRTPGWISRTFSAIARWPERLDLWKEWEAIYADVDASDSREKAYRFYLGQRAEMDRGAELLWAELEDLYTLMRMRVEGGHTAFEREKQGTPLNPLECEFPEDYFGADIWFTDWPAEPALKVVALDPSKGRDDRQGDYSAIVLLGVGRDGVMYVEADLARRPTARIVEDVCEHVDRFRPTAFVTETNQFQDLLRQELEREFQRRGLLEVPIFGVNNQLAKLTRIRRLGPHLSNRRLKFRAGSAGAKLLVDQLRDFPVGDHDDGPDALEMAIRLSGELSRASPRDSSTSNLFR